MIWQKKIMYGGSFLRNVFISLNIFVLVYIGCASAEASTVGPKIIFVDVMKMRELIGLRKSQISFLHPRMFELSPANRNLTKNWLVNYLNALKFDFANMTSSANETEKTLIKQLDKDFWDSEPLIKDADSAFRKYKYILTILDYQLEHFVHNPSFLSTPYWYRVRRFLQISLFG